MLGAQVDGPQQATFNDLHLDFYPRVVWSPFFAITTDDLKVCLFGTAVDCHIFSYVLHLHRHGMTGRSCPPKLRLLLFLC